jgi:hypothetical protein
MDRCRSPRPLVLSPFALLLLAAVTAGCYGTTSTEPHDPDVEFATLYRSQFSESVSERQEVIKSAGAWAVVWDEIAAGPPPPVDFSRDMVILYAAGEQPNGCHDAEIRNLESSHGLLEVEVDRLEPGAGCGCTPVVTRPAHAVRTAHSFDPVDFDVEQVTIRCS